VSLHGFRATGNMASARADVTATVLQSGQVLVLGGDHRHREVFDPASGSYAATGSLQAARSAHTATLLSSGKVLVAGGIDAVALSWRRPKSSTDHRHVHLVGRMARPALCIQPLCSIPGRSW
jgi:hypothetical protein